MSDLIKGTASWEEIGERTPNRKARLIYTANHEFHRLTTVLLPMIPNESTGFHSIAPRKVLLPRMPMLDTIIVGPHGESAWRELMQSPDNPYRKEPGLVGGDIASWIILADFICCLGARIICWHSGVEPYAGVFSKICPTNKLKTMCFHHRGGLGLPPQAIMSGVENRSYIHPADNLYVNFQRHGDLRKDPGLKLFRAMLSRLAGQITDANRSIAERTTIRLLGANATPRCVTTSLDVARRIYVEHNNPHPERWKPGYGNADAIAGELVSIRDVTKILVDTFPAPYNDVIKIVPWAEIPPCDACGWRKEVLVEE